MKWAKERDDLIAQTKAFVQSVTGRRPEPATTPVLVRPAPIENPFSHSAVQKNPSNPELKPIRIDDLVSVQAIEQNQQSGAAPQAEFPKMQPSDHSDVRKEIQNRIAAFQAHQHRFHREREAYYKLTLTKAHSALEDGPGGTRR